MFFMNVWMLLTTRMDFVGHPLGVLLEDCKRLIVGFSNLTVKHVFKEANKCVDKLANLAHGVDQGITNLVSLPQESLAVLHFDALGVAHLRL